MLFSSAAGILGTGGQAVRTAANACLDAVAHHRRAAGLRATSLAWGPLRGDGLFRNGIRSLSAEQVLELFDAALASADAALVAVRFDLLALREEPGPAGVPSLLRSLVRLPAPCR